MAAIELIPELGIDQWHESSSMTRVTRVRVSAVTDIYHMLLYNIVWQIVSHSYPLKNVIKIHIVTVVTDGL